MIRLGENRINKVGSSNKLYFNNGVVYQSYSLISAEQPDIPDSDLSLPDVPFLINYNAKNYEDGTLFNVAGAIYDENATLNMTAEHFGDYIKLNGSQYYVDSFSSVNDNPFNRTDTQPLTIIAKTNPQQGGTQHLFGNRGTDYNYMVRNGSTNFWLHTLYSTENLTMNVPIDYSQPNIYAFRIDNTGYGFAENYTTGVKGETKSAYWGRESDGIGLFCGGDIWTTESFLGDFYWLYISPAELTDEQVLQVISYNEGISFEPVVPEEPEEDVLEVEFTKAIKNGSNNDMYIYLYNEDESVQVCLNLYGLSTSNNNENYIPRNDYYVQNNKGYGYIYGGGGYSWIKINSVQTNITEDGNTYVTVQHIGTKYKLTFNGISFGNILLDGLTFYGPIENLITQ